MGKRVNMRQAEAVAKSTVEWNGGTLHRRFGMFGKLRPSNELILEAKRNMERGRRR